MLSSVGAALIVTRREVRDQLRDWRIIFPIVILTIVFPALMNFTASQIVNFVEQHGASIVGTRLIPFLLMIVGFFPISVSLVIALESFVGEKERHSIEPLLDSPLSDTQLYLGKLLAAMVPPLLASYLGIIVYLIGIYIQIGWRPDPSLLLQIVLLTTVQAVVMVSGAVVVSSQTTSVRAANLLASFIIIPMSFLIQGESVLMFWGTYNTLWWVIIGLVVIASLLVRTGVAHFNREELLGSEVDTLNLRWSWKIFKSAFVGQARSPWEWYRYSIPLTLRRIALPCAGMALALLAGVGIGVSQSFVFTLPAHLVSLDKIDKGFIEGLEALRFFSASGVSYVWLHNIRAILLATVLGMFTFGVLGVVILMLPMALIGYVMGNIALAGFSAGAFFVSMVLPHGLFEIPAIVLAGAAILSLGGTLAAPAKGQTIGEAWLRSLADWAKIMVGIIIPLLFAAALAEVFITPRLAIWILSR